MGLSRGSGAAPAFVELDEPLGALDRTLREQLLLDLRELLQRTDIPAIYVTHDQEEAYTIADRMILLNAMAKSFRTVSQARFYRYRQKPWAARFWAWKPASGKSQPTITAAGHNNPG